MCTGTIVTGPVENQLTIGVVHATGRPSQVKWSPLHIDDRYRWACHIANNNTPPF
ncbi:hypothetical protein T02_14560 [Trichinella nativa]|uniref:Uncharacterized protein n=1 Tax=Trichinella nativa TaxID=6335 RepID=A0A0V1LRS2_9BILA|nr:hypothetical protein T02_14560 [Trichinella nativa]KRZ83297.1 hypothetical protein T08_5466 [Trichinella sp. T8]